MHITIFILVVAICSAVSLAVDERTFAEHMYFDCCNFGEAKLEHDGTDARICKKLFTDALNGKGIVSQNVEDKKLCGLVGAVCCNRQVRQNNCNVADVAGKATANPFIDTADGGESVKLECTAACNVGTGSMEKVKITDKVEGFGTQAARTFTGCLANTDTEKTDKDYLAELNKCCATGEDLAKEKGICGSEVTKFLKKYSPKKVSRDVCDKAALACCNRQGRGLKCHEGGKQISNGEKCNHDVKSALDGTKAECCECCMIGQMVKKLGQKAEAPAATIDGTKHKGFGLQCSTIFKTCHSGASANSIAVLLPLSALLSYLLLQYQL